MINCWVCYGSVDDDKNAEWVQPCKCRGTTKWVHQTCLQLWIDQIQKGNNSVIVSCSQCNAEYILVFPPFGRLDFILDGVYNLMFKMFPFVIAGIVGSIFGTAVTFGPLTLMKPGITFVAAMGLLKLYLQYQHHLRQCQRKVLNYDIDAIFPQSPTSS